MKYSHESEVEFRFLPTVEIYNDKEDKWRWRIRTPDKKLIAASVQGFENKRDVLKNLRMLGNMVVEFCERERKKA